MIEEPGSFSGRISSPIPARGPEPSQRMSFAIFISDAASVASAPLANTTASCAASAANLFGAVTNGSPVSSAIFAAHGLAEPVGRVQAGADRGAADRELVQARAASPRSARGRRRAARRSRRTPARA